MDELLYDRVKQLKDLDDRLERIEKKAVLYSVTTDLRQLRIDLALMIQKAQQDVFQPAPGTIADHLKALWEAGLNDWQEADDPDALLQEIRGGDE